jgi:sugar O-acyltransferase (sialic acid O-acetyltransferase NeuD family)
MTQAVGVGAGGHAKVVIEILRKIGGFELIGLLDQRPELWGTKVLGVEVLGDDRQLPELIQRGVRHAFLGLGGSSDTAPRAALYERVRGLGFELVRAIHPHTSISESAVIGDGPTIMAGAIINADARLGDNVIVNTGAIVEHDCHIGDHVHIATGACLSGTVSVGCGTHIGLGARVRQTISIGQNSVVGAGAVVVSDVPDNVVVVGVPAKILENR